MHKKMLGKLALGLGVAVGAASANAYVLFEGFDQGRGESTPLATTPNSTAAEASFKGNLVGTGTETFEGFSTGTSAPLVLNFPGAGTATLSGGSGQVSRVVPGTTNGVGRYSVPSPSSSAFWEVGAGSSGDFSIAFTESIAAFGFYGIDIGDFSGTLTLELYSGADLLDSLLVSSGNVTGGSVLFFGLIAENAAEEFDSIRFRTTSGSGDIFAFDNMTIGTAEQVCTGPQCDPGSSVPVPGTLALLGLGALAIRLRRKVD